MLYIIENKYTCTHTHTHTHTHNINYSYVFLSMVPSRDQHLSLLEVEILCFLADWITVKIVWFGSMGIGLELICSLGSIPTSCILCFGLWALDKLALTGGKVELKRPSSTKGE